MSYRCVECRRGRQRGVALLTVLLVFALATLMAAQMLRTGDLAINRTGNLLDSTQARYYALGGEELGRVMLDADARGQPVDHLNEEWARSGLNFPIEEGTIELSVLDLAGLFNLNSLVDPAGKPVPAAIARFGRLLDLLELDPALAGAVADWVDADEETARGGRESSAYGVTTIPDAPFGEPSELLAVPGFDQAAWQTLADLVCALPPGTPLNVNTAPEAVLFAYTDAIRMADLERFVQARALQPVLKANDPQLALLFGEAQSAIGVGSDHFLVRSHAEFRQRHVRFATEMERDPKTRRTTVVGRQDNVRM